MEYKSNIQEVLARLKRIKELVSTGLFSDALVGGLNGGMGLMKRRIFNQSLDANGEFLGPYFSEQYERDRKEAGRQIRRKDLEFTGTLRRSIEVVSINNSKAEIRITNDDTADIARFQEQQIYNIRNGLGANEESGGRVPIFELSGDERDVVKETTRELIRQKLNF